MHVQTSGQPGDGCLQSTWPLSPGPPAPCPGHLGPRGPAVPNPAPRLSGGHVIIPHRPTDSRHMALHPAPRALEPKKDLAGRKKNGEKKKRRKKKREKKRRGALSGCQKLTVPRREMNKAAPSKPRRPLSLNIVTEWDPSIKRFGHRGEPQEACAS
jgi:hypothetical protein